jgi:shikimate kinase
MSNRRQMENIALIGFMGTGKSSVGRMVAAQLGFDFLDTDELIESRAKKTIAAIFAGDGEPKFREYERDVVKELSSRKGLVISTGGGLGANESNLAALKENSLVVCLWASPEKIWQRVKHQTHRPLLREADPMAKIRQLLAARESIYKQADVLLNTDVRSAREVAGQILHQFRAAKSEGA